MTNVAYLLFTFLACLFGIGAGLALHHVWSRTKSAAGLESDPFSTVADDETASWDAYSKWQSDNNRRFAWQVTSCGAAPLLLACASWSQRTDVVHTLCNTLTQMAGQAYICT
jgi:predicted outer membrane lipoprotein